MFNTDNLKNKIDSLEGKMEDLNSDRRLIDIDVEKKLIMFERDLKAIHNTISVIEGLGDENFAKEFSELKNSAERFEDQILVDKLDILNNKEIVSEMKGNIKDLNHKIALTTDALRILSQKTSATSDSSGNGGVSSGEVEKINSQLIKLSEKVEDISKRTVGGIGSKDFKLLFKETEDIEDAFRKLVSSVNDKMKSNDLRIESFDRQVVQINEDVSKKLKKFEKDISKIEGFTGKIEKMESVRGDLTKYYKTLDSIKNNLEVKLATMHGENKKATVDLGRDLYKKIDVMVNDSKGLVQIVKNEINSTETMKKHFERRIDNMRRDTDVKIEEIRARLEEDSSGVEKKIKSVNNKIYSIGGDVESVRDEVRSLQMNQESFSGDIEKKISSINHKFSNVKGVIAEEAEEHKTEVMKIGAKVRKEALESKKEVEDLGVNMQKEIEKNISSINHRFNNVKGVIAKEAEEHKTEVIKIGAKVRKEALERKKEVEDLGIEMQKEIENATKSIQMFETDFKGKINAKIRKDLNDIKKEIMTFSESETKDVKSKMIIIAGKMKNLSDEMKKLKVENGEELVEAEKRVKNSVSKMLKMVTLSNKLYKELDVKVAENKEMNDKAEAGLRKDINSAVKSVQLAEKEFKDKIETVQQSESGLREELSTKIRNDMESLKTEIATLSESRSKDLKSKMILVAGKIRTISDEMKNLKVENREELVEAEKRVKETVAKMLKMVTLSNKLYKELDCRVSENKSISDKIGVDLKEEIENATKSVQSFEKEFRGEINAKIINDLDCLKTEIATISESRAKDVKSKMILVAENMKNLSDEMKKLKVENKEELVETETKVKETVAKMLKMVTLSNKQVENNFSSKIESFKKEVEDINRLDIERDNKINTIEERGEDLSKNKLSRDEFDKFVSTLNANNLHRFIEKLDELEKIRESLQASSLNDFLVKFGEMKILKDSLGNKIEELSTNVENVKSDAKDASRKVAEHEVKEVLEKFREFRGNIDSEIGKVKEEHLKSMKLSSEINHTIRDKLKNFEQIIEEKSVGSDDKDKMTEEMVNKKLLTFDNQLKELYSRIDNTSSNMKTIKEQVNKVLYKNITDALLPIRRNLENVSNEIETLKELDVSKDISGPSVSSKAIEGMIDKKMTQFLEDNRKLNIIQSQINKTLKVKLEQIDKERSGNEPDTTKVDNILVILRNMEAENNRIKQRLKMLSDQNIRLQHMGDNTPIIVE